MSLRLRLILGASFILFLAEAFVLDTLYDEVRPRYKEAIEDSLVEFAQLLSATAASSPGDSIGAAPLARAVEHIRANPMKADIYGIEKNGAQFVVYATDEKGIVVYHSDDPSKVGDDFSKWNDVARTLQGKYGSRSTRLNPEDKLSSYMYVAAPIQFNGKLKGVVSVGKSELAAEHFLGRTLRNSRIFVSLLFIFLFLSIVLLSIWLTRPIQKLADYARANRGEGRVPLPKLNVPEFRDLGLAFEEMRISLEGKKTVENYVQALTHELKSPLTAIRGAAELGLEEMPVEDRKRFLGNIRSETERIQKIVDYLLEIASLESRTGLKNPESVDLAEILHDVAAALEVVARMRSLTFKIKDSGRAIVIAGEKFLLFQAIRNLVQNALEHAEVGSEIELNVERESAGWSIRVLNQGSEIPSFAENKLFEKFYSLEKPGTGRKSSGLGLSFAREVAVLHGAEIHVVNRKDARGVEARISFRQNLAE
jgi:two-component system, OmpR family, sensor histidine kinase CreC